MTTCQGKTKKGTPCKKKALEDSLYCRYHRPVEEKVETKNPLDPNHSREDRQHLIMTSRPRPSMWQRILGRFRRRAE